MNWASSLFVALLLTDITGTIFFLIGIVIGKLTENDVKFLRFLTTATLCAYLMPFVYMVRYLGERLNYKNVTASYFNLFYMTPSIQETNAVLGWIWMGLFLVLLAYRLYRRYRWAQVCRGNIPEEDERIFKVFADICAGLEIDGEVSLCRNDSVNVPCITYYHGFVVILPLKDYTQKEAEVIFFHELCHYLNRDMYLKTIGIIAALLHVFNPAAHILLRQMDLLCERCCDRAASKKGQDRFTVREYFQIILESLVSNEKNDKYQLFALADDKSNYERRVEYMVNYRRHGGLKRGMALVLAVCFLFGSGITSLAAGDGVTDVYEGLAGVTSARDTYGEADARDADAEVLEVLCRAYDLDPEDVVFMDEPIDPYVKTRSINWNVPAGKTYVSSGFFQDVGDILDVGVQGTPSDIKYQMGIQDPMAYMWYVEGSGFLDMTYYVELWGFHYFFVTNLSETDTLHIEAVVTRWDAPVAVVE